MGKEAQEWVGVAIGAANLSETELLVGEIAAAVATAEKCTEFVDRSGDAFCMVMIRTTLADALHAAGQRERAETLFAEAEQRQRKQWPRQPLLFTLAGYQYCDLLLALGRTAEARDRATKTIENVQRSVYSIGLDTLTLCRAHLTLGLRSLHLRESANAAREVADKLETAVQGLRDSGYAHCLAHGLVVRAVFRLAIGDWGGAARDLDEAREIAEPGPMRLYLCDCVLERARLALARLEAFAPLNGLIEPSPPRPAPPDAAAAAGLREEARTELDAARKLIAECGYHRRDDELCELDDVVAGRRRFADLPPRV
jgi:tetratricopeptide (TPR) repeat protein